MANVTFPGLPFTSTLSDVDIIALVRTVGNTSNSTDIANLTIKILSSLVISNGTTAVNSSGMMYGFNDSTIRFDSNISSDGAGGLTATTYTGNGSGLFAVPISLNDPTALNGIIYGNGTNVRSDGNISSDGTGNLAVSSIVRSGNFSSRGGYSYSEPVTVCYRMTSINDTYPSFMSIATSGIEAEDNYIGFWVWTPDIDQYADATFLGMTINGVGTLSLRNGNITIGGDGISFNGATAEERTIGEVYSLVMDTSSGNNSISGAHRLSFDAKDSAAVANSTYLAANGTLLWTDGSSVDREFAFAGGDITIPDPYPHDLHISGDATTVTPPVSPGVTASVDAGGNSTITVTSPASNGKSRVILTVEGQPAQTALVWDEEAGQTVSIEVGGTPVFSYSAGTSLMILSSDVLTNNLVPSADITYGLGNSDHRWTGLWFTGGQMLDVAQPVADASVVDIVDQFNALLASLRTAGILLT